MTRKMLIDEATVKLALEALKVSVPVILGNFSRHSKAIAALREALTSVPDWASEAKEQSAQPTVPQDIPDLIAGALGVSRGTAYDMMREALASEAKEQPAPVAKPHEQEPVAIHQFRSPHCSDWYDGVPDHHDGHGPYEVRTLYASPPAQRKPLTFSKLCDIEYEITHRDGDFSILKFARAIEAAHGIKENT